MSALRAAGRRGAAAVQAPLVLRIVLLACASLCATTQDASTWQWSASPTGVMGTGLPPHLTAHPPLPLPCPSAAQVPAPDARRHAAAAAQQKGALWAVPRGWSGLTRSGSARLLLRAVPLAGGGCGNPCHPPCVATAPQGQPLLCMCYVLCLSLSIPLPRTPSWTPSQSGA